MRIAVLASPLVGLLLGLGACLPARAEEDPGCARRLTVTGTAQAVQAPDFAEIRLGVDARAAGAAGALDAASKAVAGVLALARELKVPPEAIGTSAVVLEPATRPVRAPDGSVREEPAGYRALNTVTVRLADMDRLGDLLRRALDAGANRIDSVSFGLNDPDKIEADLQIAATRNARAQAAQLAEAAGARLGPLCSLATGGGPQPLRMASAARGAPAPKRVPIAAGTIQSVAEVAVSFGILP